MDKVEIVHQCEVCYIQYSQAELVEIEGITYQTWKRISPWYICKDCAEKISDALLVKVVKDVELKHLLQSKERANE